MEYRLEIYAPRMCDDSGRIKVFTSTDPFLPLRVGDLVNASAWGEDAAQTRLLRVLNVEHLIVEKQGGAINPSGSVLHRVLIYTEGAPDTAQTRGEPRASL